jgi:ABC-type lipoprotein release transport system permease subunit
VRLVPLRYPLRSLTVRRSSSLFAAVGIGMTVAVLAGVLSLRAGFEALFVDTGRDDVLVYLRPGAQSEGESLIRYPEDVAILKARPEIVQGANGQPLAAAESYLGIDMAKADGGTTIVTVRGIEPASVEIQGGAFRLTDGRMLAFGADEVIVSRRLVERLKDARIDQTVVFNVTPFTVVGVFDHDGAYSSEIWGDVDRITAATDRPLRQRLVARIRPGTDVARLAKAMEEDKQVPAKVYTERAYFREQTDVLGGVLGLLANILTVLMGTGAVLGAANTMLASVGARTREVGILVAIGYRSPAVFASFLFEAALIGLAGGTIGSLIVLPFHGIETGTTNFTTFTEVAFAFRVTPGLLLTAVTVAVVLGVLGGAFPAWRASRMVPTDALRRL